MVYAYAGTTALANLLTHKEAERYPFSAQIPLSLQTNEFDDLLDTLGYKNEAEWNNTTNVRWIEEREPTAIGLVNERVSAPNIGHIDDWARQELAKLPWDQESYLAQSKEVLLEGMDHDDTPLLNWQAGTKKYELAQREKEALAALQKNTPQTTTPKTRLFDRINWGVYHEAQQTLKQDTLTLPTAGIGHRFSSIREYVDPTKDTQRKTKTLLPAISSFSPALNAPAYTPFDELMDEVLQQGQQEEKDYIFLKDKKGRVIDVIELEDSLGSGTFGTVHKAQLAHSDYTFALKQLHGKGGNAQHEAAAQQKAHLAPQVHFSSAQHLAMTLEQGKNLEDELNNPTLGAQDYLLALTQVAQEVAHQHQQGLTHRDISPRNIILTPAGAKVLDFGTAYVHQDAAGNDVSIPIDTSLVQKGEQIFGGLHNIGPERVRGYINQRGDVYALGMTLGLSFGGRINEDLLRHLGKDDLQYATTPEEKGMVLVGLMGYRKDVREQVLHDFVKGMSTASAQVKQVTRRALGIGQEQSYHSSQDLANDLSYLAATCNVSTVPVAQSAQYTHTPQLGVKTLAHSPPMVSATPKHSCLPPTSSLHHLATGYAKDTPPLGVPIVVQRRYVLK